MPSLQRELSLEVSPTLCWDRHSLFTTSLLLSLLTTSFLVMNASLTRCREDSGALDKLRGVSEAINGHYLGSPLVG